MSVLAELIQAREDVTRAVLALLSAERQLSDDELDSIAFQEAQADLDTAAQRLTAVLAAMPEREGRSQ